MLALLPFALLRFARGDLIVGIVDSIGFIGTCIAFTYVYRTHSIHYAGRFSASAKT